MKQLHAIILALLLGLTLAACRHDPRSTSLSLVRAEALVDSLPDSTLAILQSIDPSALQAPNNRALYGLLLTMAKDKTWGDITSDTLIEQSVDYFSNRPDSRRREMLSLHYLARVRFAGRRYADAIILSLQALDLARASDDHLYMSLAARTIADSFSETYNTADALNYAKLEYESLTASQLQPALNYAMADLARAYNNHGQYLSGLNLLTMVLDSARVANDSYLYMLAQSGRARAFIGLNNHEMAIKCLESVIESGECDSSDSCLLGSCYLATGNLEKALKMRSPFLNDSSLNETLFAHELYRSLGDNDSALVAMEKSYDNLHDIISNRVGKTSPSQLIRYYELNKIAQKEKTDGHRNKVLFFFLSITLILVSISLYVVKAFKRQQKKMLQQIERAIVMQEELNSLKNKEQQWQAEAINLLISRFSFLDEVGQILFSNPDTKIAQKIISGNINDLICEFRNVSNHLAEIERCINNNLNNVIESFKKDFNDLKPADYNLFSLSIIGFSPQSIAFILNEQKVLAIYNRKRRLKDKIKASLSERKNEYLSFL